MSRHNYNKQTKKYLKNVPDNYNKQTKNACKNARPFGTRISEEYTPLSADDAVLLLADTNVKA